VNIGELRSATSGRILQPSDDAYDQARKIFNGSIERFPAAIAFCRDARDIVAVVRWAAKNHVRISVRGGGHNVAGRCIADGSVLIDLAHLRDVVISSDGKRVSVGGGCIWADVDRATEHVGVAVPGGTVSDTGVGGLTLGGGLGWLLPSYGLTCDQLQGVQMVTGTGQIIDIDDTSDGELMACLRGAGHGLGVITEFRFSACTIEQPLIGGSLIFDMSAARDILNTFFDLSCTLSMSIMASPYIGWSNDSLVLSIDLACHGDPESLEKFCEVLSRVRPPLKSTLRNMSYVELQSMLDNPSRRGRKAYWKSVFGLASARPSVEVLVESVEVMPTTDCSLFVEHLHGAFKRPETQSVYPLRSSDYDVLFVGSWSAETDERRVREWATAYAADAFGGRSAQSHYRNYADVDDTDDLSDLDVVIKVKSRTDPNNLFI